MHKFICNKSNCLVLCYQIQMLCKKYYQSLLKYYEKWSSRCVQHITKIWYAFRKSSNEKYNNNNDSSEIQKRIKNNKVSSNGREALIRMQWMREVSVEISIANECDGLILTK